MELFNQILLMLHFIGLGLGTASAVGGFVTGQLVAASPKDAPVLGRFPQMISKFGKAGLGLLWLTGLIMLWTRYGGPEGLPSTFWIKLAFVVVLTIVVGLIDVALRKARQGDMAAAKRLATFGPIGSVSLLLVVVFAVLTFN